MASKTIAVPGAGHMGRSTLNILLRHRPDDGFRVFVRDERALADASALDPQRVRTQAQALDAFIALAEDEHAFPDGIIATSAAAAAGRAR